MFQLFKAVLFFLRKFMVQCQWYDLISAFCACNNTVEATNCSELIGSTNVPRSWTSIIYGVIAEHFNYINGVITELLDYVAAAKDVEAARVKRKSWNGDAMHVGMSQWSKTNWCSLHNNCCSWVNLKSFLSVATFSDQQDVHSELYNIPEQESRGI